MRGRSWEVDESAELPAGSGRRRLLGVAVLAAMVLVLSVGFLLMSPRVDAKQKFMSLFAQAYPVLDVHN